MPLLTKLESKALWLLAVEGSKIPPTEIRQDNQLWVAGELAIDKVWREHIGLDGPQRPDRFNDLVAGFVSGMVAGGALLGLMML